MLERENKEQPNKHGSETTIKRNCESTYEDLILSLSHRLTIIETSLHSKIDRAQCMLILQNKANHNYIAKIAEELNHKIQNYEKVALEKLAEQEKANLQTIEKLKQKLKGRKKQKQLKKAHSPQKNILLLKPQQLYLESNQTMFNIIVDEISALKEAQVVLDKNIEQRNKITISLNNQVCEKIQNLERELHNSIKLFRTHEKEIENQSSQIWSHSEDKSSKIKESRSNFHKTSMSKQNGNVGDSTHQWAHLMRSIEVMQKDISNKINIKDILPIIKKSTHPLSQMIDQIKAYTEDAIESTKKILVNQSQINQQLCLVSKIGWWQSFEQKDGYAIWNKQIVNLLPQNFVYQKDSNLIIITQQGNYVFKILSPNNEIPENIMIGGNEVEVIGESIMKIQKNSAIQIPSNGNELFMSIQKI